MNAQARGGPGRLEEGRARWQRRYDAARLRDADFTTLSGLEVDPVYGPREGAVVPDSSGSAGRVSIRSPGASIHRLPRPDVDNPPVRRIR